MIFWEVKFDRVINEDGDIDTCGPMFFEDIEQCMAYVLSNRGSKLDSIQIKRRSLSIWKERITLNSPAKDE